MLFVALCSLSETTSPNGAKLMSTVSKTKKIAIYLTQKILVRALFSLSYSAAGHEFNVNELAVFTKTPLNSKDAASIC